MARWFSVLKTEIIDVIPAIIYFCIAFNLIHYTVSLGLPAGSHTHFSYLTVSLGALILGKVLIIVNHFRFTNAFANKPLIYGILWKIFLYDFFTFFLWCLESFGDTFYHFNNAHFALYNLGEELLLPRVWATQFWLLWVLVGFVVASEFSRALGAHKMRKMLFGE